MKENMKRKIAMLLTLLGVTSIVIGTTFAIYENTINTNKNHIIKTGVVNFTLTESTNGLVLDNLQELTDYEGMAQEEYYEFTIKNTGDTITDYEISLVDKPNSSYTGTILNEKYIKVGLLKNNSKEIIVNLKDVNRLIDKVTLDVEDTVNYKLRLWLDFGDLEDEAKEALVGQQIFLALKINGIQNVNKIPTGADTLVKLTNNKDNSGLYTITHAKDSTLQIGATEDITEYRYRGASPKNYVTFNNEVWRILGLFPVDDGTGNIEYRIKLIRNESIGNYYWNNCVDENNDYICDDTNKAMNDWTGATLNTYLNGTYLNSLDSTSQSLISNTKYYLGGYGLESASNLGKWAAFQTTGIQIYNYERKIKNNNNCTKSYIDIEGAQLETYLGCYYYNTNSNNDVNKLSLMYVSDYIYAGSNCESNILVESHEDDDGQLQIPETSTKDIRACNDTNWLYDLKVEEWCLTQYSFFSFLGFSIISNGSVDTYSVSLNQLATRPVLYLTSSTKITGGSGTSSDPYTLGL